ncbi:MAG TPA: VWA domain-containing protein [Actinomycetota bacterium]|nr:VWA domain-containing protein [Actinomycetota bacterium]
MRRSVPLLLALLLVGALAGPTAAAGEIHIRQIDTSAFPEVGITLSLEQPVALGADDLTVTEGGAPVEGELAVRPLDETGLTVDVALVIDTSGSMRGEPIAAAIKAAREFIAGLPANVRVAVVAFSDVPRVLERFGSERADALTAVDRLEATGETALYDAVETAAGLFAGTSQANIVLLSDGGDTASRTGLPSAAAAARRAGATIFAIGLRSSETDVAALRRLARETDGRYAPAGTADLGTIYETLAAELSNQYLVSYTSASPVGAEVAIAVSALGATDTALVLTPGASVAPPRAPEPRVVQSEESLLAGTVGLAIALGLTFIAVFAFLVMLLGAGARQRRDEALSRRLARSTSREEAAEALEREPGLRLPQGLVAGAQRAAEASGMARGLDGRLEAAGMSIRPGEFLVLAALAVLGGILVAVGLLQNALLAVPLAAVGGIVPFALLSFRARRRLSKFDAQLADILMLLASSLRAGHSFLQALDMVAKEIGDPGGHEFARIVAEIRLGRPMDDALNAMVDRIGSEDLKWAMIAVNVQREIGGNLAEVLDTVAETVRERERIRRQVQVLSSESRLSAAILSGLPFLFSLYLLMVNPDYLSLLVTDPIGYFLLGGGGALLVVGIFWMRRLVKIDV